MIKYSYKIGDTTIETLDIKDIPSGLSYETIEFEIETEVIEIIQTIDLHQRIEQLETEIADIKSKL